MSSTTAIQLTSSDCVYAIRDSCRTHRRVRDKPLSRGIASELHDDGALPSDVGRAVWMPGSCRTFGRAIRLPAVLELVGCGRSHWYALLNKKSAVYDPTAPLPFKLGPSPHSSSAWWEHEVLEWLEARAQRRFH